MPTQTAAWIRASRFEATALGLAEKAYERGIETVRRKPGTADPLWLKRLERQIDSACAWLESVEPEPWYSGATIGRADITFATAFTFLQEKHSALSPGSRYPRLREHCARCEELPQFRASAYSAKEAERSGWRER